MSRKSIFTIAFWSILLLITFYLSGGIGVLEGIFAFVFYSIVGYIFTIIWRLITRKSYMKVSDFIIAFSYRIAAFMTVTIAILWSFCFYQNNINPAYLPRYTITDGKKTVIFQSMAHIATDRFYEAVKNRIKEAKLAGYTLFYEWVRAWTPENMKKFNEAMGIVFDKSLYTNLSKLYWLREQRNKEFLGIVNNNDKNVDVSIDNLMALYEKRIKEGWKLEKTAPPINIGPLVDESMKNIWPRELSIFIYLNQAIMNFIMKNDDAQQAIMSITGQQDIFATILGDRNKHLADAILESKDDKIMILYGMLHFNGVYELLQNNNPDWHVEKVEFEYPVR